MLRMPSKVTLYHSSYSYRNTETPVPRIRKIIFFDCLVAYSCLFCLSVYHIDWLVFCIVFVVWFLWGRESCYSTG